MSGCCNPIREEYGVLIKQAQAEMHAARDEAMRLWHQYEERSGLVTKRKSGRPSVWRGLDGLWLVRDVEEILARNAREMETGERWDAEEGETNSREIKRITVAQAIRRAVRRDPELKKKFAHLSDRTLQARYQMAADCWSQARREPREREREAAMDRWREAIREVNRLCDLRDMLDV